MSSKLAQILHFVRTKSGLCIAVGVGLFVLASTLPGVIESLVAAVVGGLLLLIGMSLRLEHLEARSAAAEQRLGHEQYRQRLRESEDAALMTELDGRLASQQIMIRESAGRVQQLQPLPAVVAALEQATDRLARTKTSSEAFAVLSSRFVAQVDALASSTVAIRQLQHRVEDIVQDIGDRLTAIDEAQAGSLARLGGLTRELRIGRGETHQELARIMTDTGRDTLIEEWPERLAIEFDERRLAYFERKLVDVEARCKGRIAASADDAALRGLVASALPRRHAKVLEIGVLFAGNTVYLHDVASYLYDSFHQTLIDPLYGYYGGNEPDPYSGVLVNEHVVRENLRIGGVPNDAYELIVGLSTDDGVRRQAEERDYDAVLIDGDHSYEGVSADFAWSSALVVPGGYVLIDDYRGPSWPDVTQFVDEVAMKDDRFDLVGVFARTAVFRRRTD